MDQAQVSSTQDVDSPQPQNPVTVNSNCDTSSVCSDGDAAEANDLNALPSIDKGKGKARAQSPDYENPGINIMDLLSPHSAASSQELGKDAAEARRVLTDMQNAEREAEQVLSKFREQREELWKQLKSATAGFSKPLRKKIKMFNQGAVYSCNIGEIMEEVVLESASLVAKREGGGSDATAKSHEASWSSKNSDTDPTVDVDQDHPKVENGEYLGSGETTVEIVLRLLCDVSILHRDQCELDMKLSRAMLKRAEAELNFHSCSLGFPGLGHLGDPMLGLDGLDADMEDSDLVLAKMLSMEDQYDAEFLQSIGASSTANFHDFSPLYGFPVPPTTVPENVPGSSLQGSSGGSSRQLHRVPV